jgi:hypothetical protein
LDYTLKYQIKAGRVNFANYAQKKQLVQEGRLLGLNLYPPDNDASIITLISEGEINTTPEELAGYLEEIVLPPSSTIPDAPTGLVATAGISQATISFTPGFDGGSAIINYQYSTDNGLTFRAFSPATISSPVTITTLSSDGVTPLSSDTTYTIVLKAVNEKGAGIASTGVSVTPLGPGSAIWATYLNGTGTDAGYSVAIDSSNNVYITGYYLSTSIVTLKNASGNTQVDSSVTLPPSTPSSTNQALFLVKYNSSGIVQWATFLNGTSNDIGYSIAIDSSNNVYITGQYASSASVTLKNASGNGQVDSSITLPIATLAILIMKYNSSGIAQWATYLDGNSSDIGNSIAIDSSDNLYITGQYRSSAITTLRNVSGNTQVNSSITLPVTTLVSLVLIKYNSSGIAQWATILDGSSIDAGYSVAIDSLNNIYVTGNYSSSGIVTLKNVSGNTQVNSSITLPATTNSALVLMKYNSNGIAQWATYLDGSNSDIGYSIDIDSSDNLYITGQYSSSASVTLKNASGNTQIDSSITLPLSAVQAIFLMKYNSSGIAQWATYLDRSATSRSIKIDSLDNLYITGYYVSTDIVTLKNASGNTQVDSSKTLSSTSIALFLIKYNSNGIAQWATSLDGSGFDSGYSIAIDSSNSLYITGQYNSTEISNLKNASGNTQVDSSITLPATAGFAVVLMKYIS